MRSGSRRSGLAEPPARAAIALLLAIGAAGTSLAPVARADAGTEPPPPALAAAAPDLAERGRQLYDRAVALRAGGRAEDARAALLLLDEALPAFRAAGDRPREALALGLQGNLHFSAGRAKEALEFHARALALWQALGDPRGEAESRNNLASGLMALGRLAEAEEQLGPALASSRTAGDRRLEGSVFHNLGFLAANRSDFAAAQAAYETALALRRETGDRAGQANTLGNLGRIYRLLGRLQQALASYQEALALRSDPAERPGNRAILHNLAALHFQLGEPERAESLDREALALARESGDRLGQANMLHGLAGFAAEAGRDEEARKLFAEALALWRELGNRPGEAHTLAFLGTLEQRRGRREEALRLLGQALEIHRATGSRSGEAEALLRLGRARQAFAEADGALAAFAQAQELARATGQRAHEAEALYRTARLEKEAGRLAEARGHVEAAIARLEDLRATLASPDLRASFRAARNEPYELYIEILLLLDAREPGKGWDAAALEASERARARSLFETLAAGGIELRRGAPPALLEREAALRREIQALESRRLSRVDAPPGRGGGADPAALESEIGRKLDDYRALESELLAASPAYAALARPAALPLAGLRALLDPGTVLVEIALGEPRSHAWLLTREGLAARELPGRAALEAAARRLVERVTAPDRRAARRPAEVAAAELSAQLLGPLAELLEAQQAGRLVVVADGALHAVPFGILPFPPPGKGGAPAPQPLLARFEIVTLPSLSVLPALRRARGGPPAPDRLEVAVLADPVFGPDDPRLAGRKAAKAPPPALASAAPLPEALRAGFGRLPWSGREAAAILALVPPGAGFAALGFQADRATATGPEVSRARLVHFATHALLDGRRPERSGIVLSLRGPDGGERDGFLRLQDLYALELSADLVALSACRTALGRDLPGEGLIGLTRGFFHAGAPRVLATLWDVQDGATAELMARFYRALLEERLPAAAALRQAQLSLRGEKRWESPFFWGGFVLQGDWR